MYIKVSASLQSQLMIGGKKINSNFRESRDHIPGSVLRAAYARALIERCSYEQEDNWLRYKEQKECVKCEFQKICKNFSRIVFPTLYPLGGAPYPITARIEKYGRGNKKVIDILRSRVIKHEKIVGESAYEQLKGIYYNGKEIKIVHNLITRTAVDYKRKSAKIGALYSQNVITQQLFWGSENKKQTIFSGTVYIEEQYFNEFKKLKKLHIGADTTKGLGKSDMSYECCEEDTVDLLDGRVKRFNSIEILNNGFKSVSNNEDKQLYIVLDLITDAYLYLEDIREKENNNERISDEIFRKFLKDKIGLPSKYELDKVYKNQEVLRGYNTSENKRRKGSIVILAGAIFVFCVKKADYNPEELLKIEQDGIGENRNHGFGKVKVCDTFHMDYDL